MLTLWIGIQMAVAQQGTFVVEDTETETTTMNQYMIQPGDTLWDLAQANFGDPQYWPQLWSINEYITNPHWIYPGNAIQFTPGTTIEPPQIDIISNQDIGYVVDQEQFTTAESLCGPDVRFDFKQPTGTFVVPGFIAEPDTIQVVGTVEASPKNQSFVVEKDRVYMKLSDPELYDCGHVFSIVRKTKRVVRHPNSFFKKYGSMYQVVGEVRVLHTYESSNGNYVVGEIRSSIEEIERSDLVIPSRPITVRLPVEKPLGDLQGVVIDRLEQGHSFSTERDTLFIDRGAADGLIPGDTFYIVSQRDPFIDDSKENYELPPTVIGRVLVVDVQEESSTAVLTDVHTTIGLAGEKTPLRVTQKH